MNKDKYVFAQLVGFLDNFKFLRIVRKYDGGKYVKSYTCWNQLLTMMFGQLSNRESLRDLIVALEAYSMSYLYDTYIFYKFYKQESLTPILQGFRIREIYYTIGNTR